MGLFVLVLLFSMTTTLNLFKRSNWGTLFTGYSTQIPPLLEAFFPQKWNPSKPANLLLIILAALLSTASYPSSRGNL